MNEKEMDKIKNVDKTAQNYTKQKSQDVQKTGKTLRMPKEIEKAMKST